MQISVIIPTYKPKDYLWKTLDSLTQQTLSAEAYEIIVVLNGPRDPYLAEITDYIVATDSLLEATPTIRLIYTEEAGVSNARNRGIEASHGNYLTFVDDDDWVSATYLGDLLVAADKAILPYNMTKKHPRIIVEAYVLAVNGENYEDDYLTRAYHRCAKLSTISLFQGRSFLSSSCCKLIPRAVIGDYRFPKGIAHGEDSLFMATISHRIKEIRLCNPDAIYYRRVRAGSAQFSKRSFWQRLYDTSDVCLRYAVLLLQPWRYNPKFIFSRIAATLRRFYWGL